MIILVQPMYSKQELNADSNYVVYTSLVRAMLKFRPSWHFVVIFPDARSGFTYEEDGFFRLPNVTRVPQRISPRKFGNAITYDATWYDALFRAIGIDLVWCNLVEIAGHLPVAGEGTFEKKGRPVVVAAHNYVIHETLPYPFERMENVAFAQMSGAMLADWNVFNSDWCRQMFVDTAVRYFKPAVVDAILAKSSKINYGTLPESISPRWPDNGVPIVGYNHRLQSYKNWQETYAVLDELYRGGVKLEVLHMNNTREYLAQISHYPFVRVKLSATHDEYLRALSGCDLNTSNSQHETFCIAAIEAMAFGQPFVAPNRMTFPEITGCRENGYPYLFEDRAQQMAYLRRLLQDRNERRKWGDVLSKHVRAKFTQEVWAAQYAALFERLADFELGTPEDARDAAIAILKSHGKMTIKDYDRALSKTPVNGRQPFSNQSFPLSKVIRLVRELGGRVTMERGQQYVYSP